MMHHVETERSAATVRRILTAARELFMRRGFSAVSITDIIKAAGITKPTLYYHFADKEQLYAAMGLFLLEEMHAELMALLASAGTTRDRLIAIATMVFAMPAGDTRLMRHEMFQHLGMEHQIRLGQAFHDAMYRPIVEVMAAGVAHNELTGYTSAEFAMMFLGMLESFREFAPVGANSWIEGDIPPFPQGVAPATVVDLFLNGAAPRT